MPDLPSGAAPGRGKPTETRPVNKATEKTPVFRLLAFLLIPFMHLVGRYRIHDGHKLPSSGAFVLAPNHYSEIDPIVVGLVMWKLGRMPRYLAKASLFKLPFLGWILRSTDQVPVERTGAVRGSDPLTGARKVVEKGYALVVYPEGSLTRDPGLWPMRGKAGAVRMALETGIPLIPAAHWGAQLILPRYAKKISLFPRKTVHIVFGDPVDLSAFRGKPLDTATTTAATAVLMDAITGLLERLRNEKAPTERWNPAKNNQKETGRF